MSRWPGAGAGSGPPTARPGQAFRCQHQGKKSTAARGWLPSRLLLVDTQALDHRRDLLDRGGGRAHSVRTSTSTGPCERRPRLNSSSSSARTPSKSSSPGAASSSPVTNDALEATSPPPCGPRLAGPPSSPPPGASSRPRTPTEPSPRLASSKPPHHQERVQNQGSRPPGCWPCLAARLVPLPHRQPGCHPRPTVSAAPALRGAGNGTGTGTGTVRVCSGTGRPTK